MYTYSRWVIHCKNCALWVKTWFNEFGKCPWRRLYHELISFHSCFWKITIVICASSRSQLKVSRCLQIKPGSFGRTGWPKLLRSEGGIVMVVFLCLYNTNLLVCGGECSCPHSSLLANPMRECLRFLWWQKSIVFLFYLLASYISISREEGHTETRVKDTKLRNIVRVHRVGLLFGFIVFS